MCRDFGRSEFLIVDLVSSGGGTICNSTNNMTTLSASRWYTYSANIYCFVKWTSFFIDSGRVCAGNMLHFYWIPFKTAKLIHICVCTHIEIEFVPSMHPFFVNRAYSPSVCLTLFILALIATTICKISHFLYILCYKLYRNSAHQLRIIILFSQISTFICSNKQKYIIILVYTYVFISNFRPRLIIISKTLNARSEGILNQTN